MVVFIGNIVFTLGGNIVFIDLKQNVFTVPA